MKKSRLLLLVVLWKVLTCTLHGGAQEVPRLADTLAGGEFAYTA